MIERLRPLPAASIWLACLAAASVYAFLNGADQRSLPAQATARIEQAEQSRRAPEPHRTGAVPGTRSTPQRLPTERTEAYLKAILQHPVALRHYVAYVADTSMLAVPFDPSLGLVPELEKPDTVYANLYVFGGIDYSDPIGKAAVPLVRVADRQHERLSPGFRVRDFTSRDGAPYARISDQLVHGLERLRARAGHLGIISGYRHRAHNAKTEVGGAANSQHIAGRAADVWSSRKPPLELAALALATMGCNIGIGLGPNSLHLDVRGYLISWTYPGAALRGATFDAWVLEQCGRPIPAALARKAAAEKAGVKEDPETRTAPPSPFEVAEAALLQYRRELSARARAGHNVRGPGAVLLDLHGAAAGEVQDVLQLTRYVPAGDEEAKRLNLEPLLERCDWERQFVYVILTPSGEHVAGLSHQTQPRLRS